MFGCPRDVATSPPFEDGWFLLQELLAGNQVYPAANARVDVDGHVGLMPEVPAHNYENAFGA